MQAIRKEYELRLVQENKCTQELNKYQNILEESQIQTQEMLKNPVRSDYLLNQFQHIQELKKTCQKAQESLVAAQALTTRANAEHDEAKAAYSKLFARIQVYKTEYKRIQTEDNRRDEQKLEHELEDNYCKPKGLLQ
jgi:hypothetical protein